jgi:predicted nuclease with TOPRIM domain
LVQDHQRQLDDCRVEKIRASEDHQRQLEHVQKTAEGNNDRLRKRMEAEVADLQKHVEKLEADLTKVGRDLSPLSYC